MKYSKKLASVILGIFCLVTGFSQDKNNTADQVHWKHISSVNGELPVPNQGDQQTACLTLDVDSDGIPEFFVAERTKAPSLLMFRKKGEGWERYIIEARPLRIEAGSAHSDIDNDGDQDIVFGGEGQSNEVWWWENPYPEFDPQVPWKRYTIKHSGKTKHHDQLFGDFDGDGDEELVFWNQGAGILFLSEIPDRPKEKDQWPYKPIYTYSMDSEMQQFGSAGYPAWKGVNEHEGLTGLDIDGDGIKDIVGGGRWFKYNGDAAYIENIVDASYTFSRSAAGDFIEGGRPEIVLVVGDGIAPMVLYEWRKGTWTPQIILPEVDNGHTIDVVDFNHDGHLDIFSGEMRFLKEIRMLRSGYCWVMVKATSGKLLWLKDLEFTNQKSSTWMVMVITMCSGNPIHVWLPGWICGSMKKNKC